ncbi:unnamed protein product [Pedinophyceae sp. YPF-701]|nr:unnamed protein product [Pedinophyceae sp. YPF-701]
MAEDGSVCAACGQPAKLQCPKCKELEVAPEHSFFCSQDCFKKNWAAHKSKHVTHGWLYCTNKGAGRAKVCPDFKWTGALRPHKIGPTREVPSEIVRPDYAEGGVPYSEIESKQQQIIKLRTPEEIETLRSVCRLAREVLDAAHRAVKPGVTTDEIDRVVHEYAVEHGSYPSPLNYFNFPKSVCTSVNEVICHGIPDKRELEEGDIVNVDVTVYKDGMHGDLNETFAVGKVDDASIKLMKTAHDCLHKAIEQVKPGTRFRDLGDVISRHATSQNLSVVKTYCGHGIGDLFHCAPNIPHYARNKAVGAMKAGQVFTIEPMINAGGWKDTTWPDGWTAVTLDGSRSAQYEHTMVVTETGCEVLTARLPDSPPLPWER